MVVLSVVLLPIVVLSVIIVLLLGGFSCAFCSLNIYCGAFCCGGFGCL